MKEVTEWNGKPRMMWCWDDIRANRVMRFVVYIASDEECKNFGAAYNVTALGCVYKHCAEIEEEKRPCTGEELLEMLKEQGLPCLLRRKAIFNIVTVSCISAVSMELLVE